MLKRLNIKIFALIIFLGACSSEQEVTVFSVSYIFSDSDEEWTGDFADYPEGDSVANGLTFKHEALPANLNTSGTLKALHISGANPDKDLFMFVKRKITGLRPNKTYSLLFNIKMASSAPTGIENGAPGENVFVKVGASLVEPKKELQTGVYRMNIDKGNLGVDGLDMITIGHIGVAATTTVYTIINRSNSSTNDFQITTDATGELWLVVGTDSGFEGTTSLYYTQIDVYANQLD